MNTLTHTYTAEDRDLAPRTRSGGPRQPRGDRAEQHNDWYQRYLLRSGYGSHMPLDTDTHWEWRNPLNIIPAFLLLMVSLAAIGLLVG